MKLLQILLISLSIFFTSLSAIEYGTLKQVFGAPEETIVLEDGDLLEILSLGGIYPSGNAPWSDMWLFYKILPDGSQSMIQAVYTRDFEVHLYRTTTILQTQFVGPCTLVARSFAAERGESAAGLGITVDYKITRASEIEYKNVNIVALPSATVGAGTHEIVVEASDDLQTWTPFHSSSIGGNKAFFRTRVVAASN